MLYMERIVIQSNIANLVKVEQFLDTVCDTMNIHNYYATISVAVLQAVENAILHGNKSDESKSVSIKYSKCRGGIVFVVEDEGEGFNYKGYSGLSLEGGKGDGIFLMQTLSDSCTYSKGGKRVKLEFMIQGIEASRSLERAVTLQNFFDPKRINV